MYLFAVFFFALNGACFPGGRKNGHYESREKGMKEIRQTCHLSQNSSICGTRGNVLRMANGEKYKRRKGLYEIHDD